MTRKEAEESAAIKIITLIESLLERQEQVVFGVPGGRSVSGIFKLLLKANIPWEKVRIFMVDERLVPISDPQSNFLQLKKNLTSELVLSGKLPKDNVHPFIYSPVAADSGVKKYEEELRKVGGKYDIVLLSCGEDGHVGGLFPQLSVLRDGDYFIKMNDSPKPPSDRMSMSRELLLQTTYGILLFFGEGKKNAYQNFLDEKVSWKECPAKLVQELNKHFVYTDY